MGKGYRRRGQKGEGTGGKEEGGRRNGQGEEVSGEEGKESCWLLAAERDVRVNSQPEAQLVCPLLTAEHYL